MSILGAPRPGALCGPESNHSWPLLRQGTTTQQQTPGPQSASELQLWRIEGVAWSAQRIPMAVSKPEPPLSFYVAPQLSSRSWVNPVPDPLLLRKSGGAGNQTRDLWICSQKLWPLDHRGGEDRGHCQERANDRKLQLSQMIAETTWFRTNWYISSSTSTYKQWLPHDVRSKINNEKYTSAELKVTQKDGTEINL
jgi:hypothetical protein